MYLPVLYEGAIRNCPEFSLPSDYKAPRLQERLWSSLYLNGILIIRLSHRPARSPYGSYSYRRIIVAASVIGCIDQGLARLFRGALFKYPFDLIIVDHGVETIGT